MVPLQMNGKERGGYIAWRENAIAKRVPGRNIAITLLKNKEKDLSPWGERCSVSPSIPCLEGGT